MLLLLRAVSHLEITFVEIASHGGIEAAKDEAKHLVKAEHAKETNHLFDRAMWIRNEGHGATGAGRKADVCGGGGHTHTSLMFNR